MSPRNAKSGGSSPRTLGSGASPVPEPTPVLTPITTAMNTLGALIVLGMVVIVNIDVFGRWLANAPLAGTLEMTEMGVVAVVYLTIAHAVGGKRLTRSDALLGVLANRGKDRLVNAMRFFFNCAGVVVFALIAWGQIPRVIDAWERGYFKGNVGIFTAPTWPLEAIMLLGAVAAGLQFLILAWRRLSDLKG
ncbi:TRAP transporter small permease [Roseivivax sp. GX 12232]|uniref:TRAP transporter small permease subunit n=1 Tax=Roseivivax sp. GX 12232 TaxID=2900547 RepID=UPI001E3D5D67|nr:TRAP transporter small permease [Roseivivax sp. GX 12232]